MNHAHTVLKLYYWTPTLVVSHTSTLITGVSSLIPSSSMCLTILGYVANLLAISALYSAWSIMVKFALVAQSKGIMTRLDNDGVELGALAQCEDVEINKSGVKESEDSAIWDGARSGLSGQHTSHI
ncbi:hypothetical protein Tco_0262081 [Tanacetum coccineum]